MHFLQFAFFIAKFLAFLTDYFCLFRGKIFCNVYLYFFSACFAFYFHFIILPGICRPGSALCSGRFISGEDGGHRILAKGEDGFSAQVFADFLGNAAALGFLAIVQGDGLGGTGDHGIRPNAILITNAVHAVNLTNFKLHHFPYFLSFGGFCFPCPPDSYIIPQNLT